MKKAKIVVAGKYGQKVIGPFYEEEEDKEKAERWANDLNKLLTDPEDVARVIPLPDRIPTPQSVAGSLNEVTPRLDLGTAPEFADVMGKGESPQTSRGFTDEIGISYPSARQSGPSEEDYDELDALFDDSVVADDTDDTDPMKGD